MKRLTLLFPLAFALLTACTPTPTPVELATLTVSGVTSPVVIDGTYALNVTATGTDGQPFAGTPTFASSSPAVVQVNADGKLSVKHLNTEPVVLTVTLSGKTASLTLDTYGLDVVGGTYQTQNTVTGKPGCNFSGVYRGADGQPLAIKNGYTINGPAGFNGDTPLNAPLYAGTALNSYNTMYNSTVPAVTGWYSAAMMLNGTVYQHSFYVNASSMLPLASDMTATVTADRYSAAGTLPTSGNVVLYAYNATQGVAVSPYLTALPASGPWSAGAVPSGTSNYGAFSVGYNKTSGQPFPDQINRSFTLLGTITLP